MARLTDKTTATAVTQSSLVHIVNTNDVTQNSAGSSYKANLGQVASAIGGYENYTAVTITSADILVSNSIPFEILPSPGANSYYDLKILLEYTYNTTAYVGGGFTVITDGVNTSFTLASLSNYTTDSVNIIQSMGDNLGNSLMAIDSPLYFYSTTSDPTTGDGEILLKIWYTIRTFG